MTTDTHTDLDELTAPQPESTAPEYLAWRDAKVRCVLADKDAEQPHYKTLDEIVARYARNAR